MASYNRVILAGNLTRDPQLSYTPSNTPVCEFGLAVSRKYRDRDGNQQEDVCFADIVSYGRQAEVVNQYMSKGSAILVEGRLRFRQWTNKEGQKRSKLDVFCENFTFLGGGPARGNARGAADASRGGGGYASDEATPAPTDDAPPAEHPDIPF